MRDNGLSLVLVALFILFFEGQTVFGWLNYNDEKDAHYQPEIGFVQSLGLEPSARLSSKSAAMSENSLLERVTAAPRRRHKSGSGPRKRITNMDYGDRLRDTVIPEMQGMRKDAACRQFPDRRVSSRVIVDLRVRVPLQARRRIRSSRKALTLAWSQPR